MLDLALLRFVGAGIVTIAPGLDVRPSPGAAARGEDLVAHLLAADPVLAKASIERAVRHIWLHWSKSGLAQDLAIHHVNSLPSVLDSDAPDTDIVIAAMAVARMANRLGRQTFDIQARRLATDIVMRAEASGNLDLLGLNPRLSFFFLEVLLTQLLAHVSELHAFRAALDDFFAGRPPVAPQVEQIQVDDGEAFIPDLAAALTASLAESETPDAPSEGAPEAEAEAEPELGAPADHINSAVDASADPKPAVTPPLPEPVDPVVADIALGAGIPAAALAEAKRALLRRHGEEAAQSAQLSRAAHMIALLSKELDDAPADVPHDQIRMRTQARDYLLSGRFTDAEIVLARAEDSDIKAAQVDLATASDHLKSAALIRTWRGKLQDAQCDYRRAARHYGLAIRHVPRADYDTRWRYSRMQVAALVQADADYGDPSALTEAAKICSDTIVVLHDNHGHAARAEAQALLGRLLIRQGLRSGDSASFDSARRHLSDAADQFEEAGDAKAAHDALHRRADACRLYGEARADEQALSEAVTIYEMLLDATDATAEPTTWHLVRQKLGLALAALGVNLKSDEILEFARETLSAPTPASAEPSIDDEALTAGMSEAALARALFALGLLRADDEPVKEATRIMRRALVEADAGGTRPDAAVMRNELAEMLLYLAENSDERTNLDEIRVLKAEALAGLDAEHAALAGAIKDELARLDDRISRTRGSTAAGTA